MAVNWGVLSTALINDLVVDGIRGSTDATVVAIASRDQTRADAAASRLDIPRAHGSYEALLADDDVHAVYISLPNGMHVEWTVAALEAGKHVLIEKPFDRRAAEVIRAAEVADRTGLMLSEAFMWRYNPQTALLRELIADGTVGEVLVVRAAFSFPLEEIRGAADTRFDPGLDGGSLMDVGCYCVSAARLIGGEPVRVHAEQVLGPSGVDVALTATMRMDSEILVHFDCGFRTRLRSALEVVGERGTLVVDDPWHARRPGITLQADGEAQYFRVEPADSYRLELEHVSRAIEGREPLRYGPADAIAQARAIEALYASADSGRTVELN